VALSHTVAAWELFSFFDLNGQFITTPTQDRRAPM